VLPHQAAQAKINRMFLDPIVCSNWARFFPYGVTLKSFRNRTPEDCGSPIYLASNLGFQAVVEAILSLEADPLKSIYRGNAICDNALLVAAFCGHFDVLEIFLDMFLESRQQIPKSLVREVVSDISSPRMTRTPDLNQILAKLWDTGTLHAEERVIDDRIVLAAASNARLGDEVMGFLLDRQDLATVMISDSVVCQVLHNNGLCASKIMGLLLDRRREDVRFTDSDWVMSCMKMAFS
jgi:hypothetical protein